MINVHSTNQAEVVAPKSAVPKKPTSDEGVQLWENGPYWAEYNIGATKPEDPGYYFWWGDTVGYRRDDADYWWVSVKDGSGFIFSKENCPTLGKSNPELQALGCIDSTGNLVAAHDAATQHWGAPWRMPTNADFDEMMGKCNVRWTTQNGVEGYVVTGKGAYASKRIFLPGAGYGNDSYHSGLGSDGYYWSSTPDSGYSDSAWDLYFDSSDFRRGSSSSHYGQSVRPVRGFAK